MARKKRQRVRAEDIEGLKYLDLLEPFLERLCGVGTERDRAGNRDLYFDQVGIHFPQVDTICCGLVNVL